MRHQVQQMIVSFISENPGSQISAVVKAMPEIDRSSISSALTRLALLGKLNRKQGVHGCFEYTLANGESAPEVIPVATPAPAPVTQQAAISPLEWECKFSKAEDLLSKGLTRRANHAFLELLDVTSEATLREKVIRRRNCCGSKPHGDDSTVAGRYVGEHK